MPDVLVLTLHPLPESPPTGDMSRPVVVLPSTGLPRSEVAWVVANKPMASWTAWSELPVFPAPEDRLTTEDIEVAASWAATKGEQWGPKAQYPNLHYANECADRARRLRAALGIKP